MTGLVIKNTGSLYLVKKDDGELIECVIKGNFRIKEIRSTNPIAVGDRVVFEQNHYGTTMITDICERRNYIIRRSSNLSKHSHILAANIDLVALVVTISYPETSTVFVDRFLATAEAYQISACLVFNKIDRYSDAELEYLEGMNYLYESLGYPTFQVSALQPNTLTEFVSFITGKTTLISGNSGVGKSTLINAVIPNKVIKTGKISDFHNKGTHTTTFSEMFDLPDGGYLIDTPGIKGFGIIDMTEQEIGHCFKEIFDVSKQCRFANCTHVHEPGCAVREAVQNFQISESRYKSYLSILEDCHSGKYR